MKKIFMVLLSLQICLSGFSVGGVSAASDDSIEHEHIWVETSETIHHDAEYAIKTTWFYGLEWYDYYPDGTVPDGPNKYHINYGNSPYGKFEDMYDFTCYYIGGSLENIQEEYIYEWITIDNYENYNLSYDEYVNYFSNYFKDAIGYANIGQNIFGQNDITAERDFNPNYDEIVMISGIPAIKAYDEFGKAWHDVELGYTNQKFLDGEDVCNTIYDYYPVAQKEIFIDEYDETLTYHVCEICGESYTTRESNRTPIEVPQPAEDHPLTKLKGATVEMYDFPKTQYELGEELDLTGGIGMVEVLYETIETGEINDEHLAFFFDDDYADYEDITVTVDASEFNSSVEGVYTIYVTYSDVAYINGYEKTWYVPYTVELSYQVTVGNPTITTIKGDVNNDGTLNIADAVLLQKWLLGVPDTHLENWKAADLYKDDRLDVFDLCLMKRMLINENK